MKAVREMQPGEVMSVREAAKEIGAHYVTLYRWVTDCKIVYINFGGTIFIPVLEVERLKRERAKNAHSEVERIQKEKAETTNVSA